MIILTNSDLVDMERCNERIKVHYNNDARHMIDLLRYCIVCDSSEDYGKILSRKSPLFTQVNVVGILDGVSEPSPSGYQDIKLYVKDENDFISTCRFISLDQIKVHRNYLDMQTALILDAAKENLPDDTYFTAIIDNFHFDQNQSITLISGFPDLTGAIFYAKARTYEKLKILSKNAKTAAQLYHLWYAQGENAVVAHVRKDPVYVISSGLDSMIIEAPVIDNKRHWHTTQVKHNLLYQQLNLY